MLARAKFLLLLGTLSILFAFCGNVGPLCGQAQREATCLHCRDAAEPSAEILASAPAAIPWTLQSHVNEVTVFFSVRDGQKFVQDLSVGDINITDNGKSALHITEFGKQEDLPLRVGLLIDTSGSVNP